jgi:hypothetical protein
MTFASLGGAVPFGRRIGVHHDLHVWLWKANKRGLFDPWNPLGRCA